MTISAVSTTGLVKRYGTRRALDGFTLSVPRSAILGLVGPNGAGKTTWMQIVAGFIKPTLGEINLLGQGYFNADHHAGKFAILPQDSDLPLESHPEELLCSFGRLQGLSATAARDSAIAMLKAVNLSDRAKSTIKSLSHGMRKRVMLAQCFIGSPEVVFLDEPLNGLDPAECDRMRRFIAGRRGQCTIVISSHNLNDIERLCTHIAFVDKGKVTSFSTIKALTQTSTRVEYSLSAMPSDINALTALLTDAEIYWNDADKKLICTFRESAGDIATVNRKLIPAILQQTDIISVTCGQSLEQAYLASKLNG